MASIKRVQRTTLGRRYKLDYTGNIGIRVHTSRCVLGSELPLSPSPQSLPRTLPPPLSLFVASWTTVCRLLAFSPSPGFSFPSPQSEHQVFPVLRSLSVSVDRVPSLPYKTIQASSSCPCPVKPNSLSHMTHNPSLPFCSFIPSILPSSQSVLTLFLFPCHCPPSQPV